MPEFEDSSLGQLTETPLQGNVSFFVKLKTNWSVVLGVLGSIVVFAALIYAAYSYGRRGQEAQPTPTVTSAPTAVAVTPFITPVLSPAEVSPSIKLEVTPL